MNKQVLYLEDIHIGQKFFSKKYEVTEDEIIAFAKQYDPQVFHTEPKLAELTFFDGLAASGWMTAAISSRLFMDAMPFDQGMVGVDVSMQWPKPTRAGEILHAICTITKVTPSLSKPYQGFIEMEVITSNQHGEAVQNSMITFICFAKGTTFPID